MKPDILVQLPQLNRPLHLIKRHAVFFRLAGVKKLYGFNPPVYNNDWHPNEPHRLIQLLNIEGFSGSKPEYAIPIDSGAKIAVQASLKEMGIDLDKPFLVFCGGGKATTQQWPLERYAVTLREIHRITRLPIIGIGGDSDIQEYKKKILPVFPSLRFPVKSLALPELTELLREATCYIGNDTGPMHLAAAVGCPVVAIMSARNKPGQWDPDVEQRLLIRHRTECEGCWLVECGPEQHKCMTAITSEDVVQKAIPFISDMTKLKRLKK